MYVCNPVADCSSRETIQYCSNIVPLIERITPTNSLLYSKFVINNFSKLSEHTAIFQFFLKFRICFNYLQFFDTSLSHHSYVSWQ